MVNRPFGSVDHQLMQYTGPSVKATVQPPREGFVPNPERKSNPFAADTEPDWVPSSGLTRSTTSTSVERKPVPPPRHGTFDGVVSLEPSQKKQVPGKSPPAVPRKPISLSSQPSPGTPAQSSSQSVRSNASRPSAKSSSTAVDLLGDDDDEQIMWKPLVPQ